MSLASSLNVPPFRLSALNSRARAGDARGAVNLLSEMEEAGIAPSVVSFATAIHAASSFNSSSLASALLSSMEPAGVVPNAFVFTAALSACENDPDDAAASAAAQSIVDTMAAVQTKGASEGDMDKELMDRCAAQVRRLLGRNLAGRDLNSVKADEAALGVSLTGRQTAV